MSRAESNARYILLPVEGIYGYRERACARARGNRLRSFMQIRESNARATGRWGVPRVEGLGGARIKLDQIDFRARTVTPYVKCGRSILSLR